MDLVPISAAWACVRMEILFSLVFPLLCCCAARTFCLRGYGPLRDRFMCHTSAADLLLSDLAFPASACGWHARQKCSNLFDSLISSHLGPSGSPGSPFSALVGRTRSCRARHQLFSLEGLF